jgi:four helix bundle protein
MDKMKSFTDLIAWQKGHKLVIAIYKITKSFPKEERYSIVDQMRRAVISITSCTAEGFHRRSSKEKIQFYYMALASLTELQNQLLISRDVGYLSLTDFHSLAEQTVEIRKIINGLIRSTKKK